MSHKNKTGKDLRKICRVFDILPTENWVLSGEVSRYYRNQKESDPLIDLDCMRDGL